MRNLLLTLFVLTLFSFGFVQNTQAQVVEDDFSSYKDFGSSETIDSEDMNITEDESISSNAAASDRNEDYHVCMWGCCWSKKVCGKRKFETCADRCEEEYGPPVKPSFINQLEFVSPSL